jgi:hypothetical protein
MKLKIVLSILLAVLAATYMVTAILTPEQTIPSTETTTTTHGQGSATPSSPAVSVQLLGDERDGGWP